jgi:hypothetical protein
VGMRGGCRCQRKLEKSVGLRTRWLPFELPTKAGDLRAATSHLLSSSANAGS